jgi:hypothetical protein
MRRRSQNGYASPTIWANNESAPSVMVGPSTKNQLNVTRAVMIISPSMTTRVRDVSGMGRVGSKRIPSRKNGYTIRKAASAQDGKGAK